MISLRKMCQLILTISLESFLQEPERLTDDDVMLLLKLIFHRQDTQELLKKLLEREKPETP